MSSSNRPLSPHLQIYKPQLTSVLSILHRATGVVITMGAIAIAGWLWSIASGSDLYTCFSAILNSGIGKAGLVIWSMCTAYHLCNGIRHLAWDFGFGFDIEQAYLTGKLVLLGTVILTLTVWLI